jgi:hypothetical protein
MTSKKIKGKSQLMPKKAEQKQVKNNDFTGFFFFFKSVETVRSTFSPRRCRAGQHAQANVSVSNILYVE